MKVSVAVIVEVAPAVAGDAVNVMAMSLVIEKAFSEVISAGPSTTVSASVSTSAPTFLYVVQKIESSPNEVLLEYSIAVGGLIRFWATISISSYCELLNSAQLLRSSKM